MIPLIPNRVKGTGAKCPCCLVQGVPSLAWQAGIIRRWAWVCPRCGAQGGNTRTREPGYVMWTGIDMAKAPMPVKARAEIRARDLGREITVTRRRVSIARKRVAQRETVESCTVVLDLMEHLEYLLKRKLAIALDFCGNRK